LAVGTQRRHRVLVGVAAPAARSLAVADDYSALRRQGLVTIFHLLSPRLVWASQSVCSPHLSNRYWGMVSLLVHDS